MVSNASNPVMVKTEPFSYWNTNGKPVQESSGNLYT
uniref:Uncharacterized protein n=1 Tax=Siphoviridae sp. ctPEx3 TaxID=2823578 RepID=A0A8S5LFU6_9CAUD|nr:MAG TPA: hypothetical protein [Siphoviridae sp. ctPEx3]